MRFEVAAPRGESSWSRTMLQLKSTARSPLQSYRALIKRDEQLGRERPIN
jgi:hypothetical protein